MKKITIIALVFAAADALAWGDLGHSTIGFVAEQHLTPEGKTFLSSILGQEPLAVAAVFPDHVRDDGRFGDFGPYHYVELPPPEGKVAPRSADTIIEEVPKLLLRTKDPLSVQQKQILLRYFIHVLGDLHQPLHVGNGVDRGGNTCEVIFPAPSGPQRKTNLHTVWDTGIIEHLQLQITQEAERAGKPVKYFSYRTLGEWILREATADKSLEQSVKLAQNSQKNDWYSEAQALHAEVYPDVAPTGPQKRRYCFGAKKLPKLTPAYIQRATSIVRKRLLLAGLRLAFAINAMAKEAKATPWTAKDEEKFFGPLLPTSKGSL